MLSEDQKKELISRVEEEYGVKELFIDLGVEKVSKRDKHTYCVCPFHEGADNPNGFAYSNGFGYCFTQCNRKYDLFDVVMRMKSCDFVDAVSYLSELVGVDVSYTRATSVSSDALINRAFLSSVRRVKSKKQSVEWKPIDKSVFNDITPSLHTMLRREGFDNDVRDYFDLGFAQSGYLANRITVPIDYIDGSIVTISGRSVLSKDELEMTGTRRYQIWFDTDKSVTLYNISRALPYVEFTKEIFLVEGFKSVWRLYQWGYGNAVATMGTSLSDEQRKILLKLGVRVIVVGDRDEAGKKYNKLVYDLLHNFSDIEIMDMYKLNVPEKSSVDDITKNQFQWLYNTTMGREGKLE